MTKMLKELQEYHHCGVPSLAFQHDKRTTQGSSRFQLQGVIEAYHNKNCHAECHNPHNV